MNNRYKSFSYEISTDPQFINDIYGISPELCEQLQTLYFKAQKGGSRIIEKLNHLIEKYPGIPILKNYLTVAYLKDGKDEEAIAVTHRIIKEHPDYIYGKFNLALEYYTNKQFEKIPEVLGPLMEIHALYPDRNCFHLSEVTGFFKLAIMYFCAIGNLKEAETRYEILEELAPEHHDTINAFHYLLLARIDNGKKRLEEEEQARISVVTNTYNKSIQRKTKPKFKNIEINWLYKYDLNIDHEKLKTILHLPYENLVSDLILVLKDSFFRYEHFKKIADASEEWPAEKLSFPIHAIYLLGELKAEESLQDILETFCQGKEFIEFWYGDFMTGKFWEPLLYIAGNKLDVLKEFVLSPGIWAIARSEVTMVASQIALHYPERTNEIISWFRDIFRTIAEKTVADKLIDTDFLGLAVCNAIDFRGSELLPEIKKLYDLRYVSSFINGDFEEVEKDIHEPLEDFDNKELLNIYDRYHQIIEDFDEELDDFDYLYDEFDDDFDSGSTSVEPYHADPKIGRNDPCPCGSGKKYKKCCFKIEN